MIYEVSHRTVYRYSQPVSISHHLLHLTPRDGGFQACRDTAVEITPAPTVRAPGIDYFGNPTTFVTIQQNHVELVLHALSSIEVADRPIPDAAATPAWEAVREQALDDRSPEALEALEFTFASPYVPLAAELRAYAAASFPPGRPILAGCARADPPHLHRLHLRARRHHPGHRRRCERSRCAAASARTSPTSRSPACARSGCRRAMSAAIC